MYIIQALTVGYLHLTMLRNSESKFQVIHDFIYYELPKITSIGGRQHCSCVTSAISSNVNLNNISQKKKKKKHLKMLMKNAVCVQ